MKTGRPRTEKRTTNGALWTLLVALLVSLLVSAPGCGQEPAQEARTTGEATAPVGPTEDRTAASEPAPGALRYVALGDSLATGYGADRGYVARYADLLRADTGANVEVRNLGVNGLTSGQLRAGIEGDRRVKDAIGRADVVTLNIGANDLLRARQRYRSGGCGGADNQDCLRKAVAGFRANWDAIMSGVLAGVRSPDAAVVRTMDFYYPSVAVDATAVSWPAAGANDFEVFRKYVEGVNSHIAQSSEARGVPHAKAYESFNGPNGDEDPSMKGYVSEDGIHPSNEGHAAIARELGELGYEPLHDRGPREARRDDGRSPAEAAKGANLPTGTRRHPRTENRTLSKTGGDGFAFGLSPLSTASHPRARRMPRTPPFGI